MGQVLSVARTVGGDAIDGTAAIPGRPATAALTQLEDGDCLPLAELASVERPALSRDVWDRLWCSQPPDRKDDALLAREKSSPRWNIIVQRLEAALGSLADLETVELGSGRGDLSVLLAQRGARVTLLDASARALQQAKHRFDRLGLAACYQQGDILGIPDSLRGRFDVALSSGVAEHFRGRDRTRVIRAHFDALRPGGIVVVSVPNAWCLPYRLWKLYLEVRGWWPYGMEIPYTKRELVRLAKLAGFDGTELYCLAFRQSVGTHLWQGLCGSRPDWTYKPSRFDATLGFTLLVLASRGTNKRASVTSARTPVRPTGRDSNTHPGRATERPDARRRIERHFLCRGHGLEFDMEAQWVRGSIPPTAQRVIDIGCGIGGLFPVTGRSRTVGVDQCADGLAHTRNRFPLTRLVCATAERLPFADQVCDAVTCQHVIEHIEASRQACREWFRILRPGGLLLLLTPNASFRDLTVFADETHVRLFDHNTLRALLASIGFTITDIRTIGLPWFCDYHRTLSGWRLRRLITKHARLWSVFGGWRWKGQTLCCVARRPTV